MGEIVSFVINGMQKVMCQKQLSQIYKQKIKIGDSMKKQQSKFLSRKFLFTVFWAVFMVFAFFWQAKTTVELPLTLIVSVAAFATVGYGAMNLIQKKMEGTAAAIEAAKISLTEGIAKTVVETTGSKRYSVETKEGV